MNARRLPNSRKTTRQRMSGNSLQARHRVAGSPGVWFCGLGRVSIDDDPVAEQSQLRDLAAS